MNIAQTVHRNRNTHSSRRACGGWTQGLETMYSVWRLRSEHAHTHTHAHTKKLKRRNNSLCFKRQAFIFGPRLNTYYKQCCGLLFCETLFNTVATRTHSHVSTNPRRQTDHFLYVTYKQPVYNCETQSINSAALCCPLSPCRTHCKMSPQDAFGMPLPPKRLQTLG